METFEILKIAANALNEKKGHEIAIVFQAKLSDDDMAKDKFPLIEPEFEGCFSEFIEINSENKIYPQEALQFIDVKTTLSDQRSFE